MALARADTAAARAALITARAFPNPSLSAQRTGAPPQRHLIVDVPFDAPWVRGPRVSAARAQRRAAQLRFLSERAAALLDVDTTYTRALGAQARFRLSRQTARDADSLRKMTAARRDAGDASDLDVDLATVAAGQQLNVASGDSVTYASTVIAVQTLMGMSADSVAITLADSLPLAPVAAREVVRSADSASVTAGPLATPTMLAAQANLEAAELAVTRERRSLLTITSLQVGVEWHDPTVEPVDNEKLWVLGLSVPLPIFNQNQGAIAQARAERDRARAELDAARLSAREQLATGLAELASLRARVARDQDLVTRAERVAQKSLAAYREGASALPAVLEARRTAREALGQYVDDLTALLTLEAELRALTRTVPPQ